ncbi:MAG: universal stress protein [Phyllobacterium sp.]|uniref:universal stress protein n=1 Tax=Phyllobacterium sp. TaxID=1871046 RepID=UPI0030EFB7C4
MEHILVAMDVSEVSDRAFERALQLAQAHDVKLTVMHVIDEKKLDRDLDPGMEDQLIEQARIELCRHWANLSELEAERISLTVKTGSVWKDILAEVETRKVGLIVLGLHHPTTKDRFIGTKASHIVCNSIVPVLVVKDKPAGPYRSVVAATDFSSSSEHALSVGLELAPDAAFCLLHVFQTPFSSRIKLNAEQLAEYERPLIEKSQQESSAATDAYVKRHGKLKASITPKVERGETATGIGKIVDEQNADLLVMGTHSRSGIVGSMIGSYAIGFLNAPPCDVLVSR